MTSTLLEYVCSKEEMRSALRGRCAPAQLDRIANWAWLAHIANLCLEGLVEGKLSVEFPDGSDDPIWRAA